jgi:hypothetical protein
LTGFGRLIFLRITANGGLASGMKCRKQALFPKIFLPGAVIFGMLAYHGVVKHILNIRDAIRKSLFNLPHAFSR